MKIKKRLTNSFGELVFYNSSSKIVERNIIKSLFCKHTYEHQEITTGGGWMADNFSADICKHCGKWKNLKRIW